MSERVLIIGAGHAAGQVVGTLTQRGFGGSITLIGDEPVLPYQRPPLSKKFLAGELDVNRLLLRPPDFYESASIDVRPGQRITGIDRRKKTAVAESGETFPYDRLVIATGARPRRLDVPGTGLAGVHYLRTIADVEGLRPELVAGRSLVIVGAGYIGLEVASVAAGIGAKVTVVETTSRVLSRVVSPAVSAVFEKTHREHGVDFELDACVAALAGEEHVDAVVLDDGRHLKADVVLIGIGAQPNVELARESGLEVADGIVVDERCRTSDPDIYAIGDCSFHPSPLFGRSLRLESVHNALEQAKTAAANLAGEKAMYADVPWFWSDQYDLKLQMAGLAEGHDAMVIRGDPEDRAFACLFLNGGRLIAIHAVNRPRDFMQARTLISAGTTLETERAADVNIPLADLAT